MNIRQAAIEGGRAALAAFGLPSQPSLSSVGIKPPSAPGIPRPGAAPSRLSTPGGGSGMSAPSPSPSAAAGGKLAFNVGMGASNSTDGAGAPAGEPTDTARRQRSAIDRAFQRNEDDYATSSMPAPGSVAP